MTAMTGMGPTIGASPQGKRKARWRTWAELARVSELPTVGVQALACVALADGKASPADWSLASLGLACSHLGRASLGHSRRLSMSLLAGAFTAFASLGALHGNTELGMFGGAAIVGSIALRERVSRVSTFAPVVTGLQRAIPYVCAILAMRGSMSTDAGTAAAAMLAYATGQAEVERSPSFSMFAMAMLVAPFLLATLAGSSHDVAALVFVVGLGALTALSLVRAARAEGKRAASALVYGATIVDAVVLARFGFLGLAVAATLAPFASRLMMMRQASEPTRGA